MENVASYTILTKGGHEPLATEVNRFIKNGWQPQGGVAVNIHLVNVSTGQTQTVFSQAMVKLEKETTG